MKKIGVLFIVFSLAGSIYGQTGDEWFKQKKTQIKYLTQQLAALQVYEGYLSKGYKIANGGLHAIGDIKNGEFHLHEAFFSSLSLVNPAIRHYSRIVDIIALQRDINKLYKQCYKSASESKQLSGSDLQYIHSVFTDLLQGCTNDVDDLIALTTNGQVQLSDDERLQRIKAIYKDMQDNYAFTQSFCNETKGLIRNSQKEQNEATSLISLYNLK